MAVVGWLLVSRNSKPHLALPVPRQALVGLTRAVSFSLQTITEEQSLLQQDRRTSGSWRDRCWRLAAGDPAVAIWLVSEEKQPRSREAAGTNAEPGTNTKECSAGQAAFQWLDRLEESLVTFSTPQGMPVLKQADSVSVQELSAITGMALSDTDTRDGRTADTRSTAGRWLDQCFAK